MSRYVHKLPGIIPAHAQPKPRPQRSFRRWGVLLATIGIVILGYWYLFRSSAFAIERVEVVNVDVPAVRAITDQLIGQNIFLLNATTLESTVKTAYPPVASLTLVRGLPHTVRVEARLRTPALRWQIDSNVFIVDKQGRVFEQGDKPEYASLPLVVDQSLIRVTLGQDVVSSAFIQFLEEAKKLVPELLRREFVRGEVSTTTFHMDLILESDVRVKVTIQRPVGEQLASAAKILAAHPEAKHIDVRVPTWGYWK